VLPSVLRVFLDLILFVAHQIGCSVRRWALEIISYEIAAIRLFRLTQSRRLRPILQGEFDVTVLESPPPQPPYVFDISEKTIHQALDMARTVSFRLSGKIIATRSLTILTKKQSNLSRRIDIHPSFMPSSPCLLLSTQAPLRPSHISEFQNSRASCVQVI
jgi:hypothetical protein